MTRKARKEEVPEVPAPALHDAGAVAKSAKAIHEDAISTRQKQITEAGEHRRILEHEDPLQYLTDIYSGIHSGDKEVLQGIMLAVACQSIVNSQGIQPRLGGEKGSGKSSSIRAALHLIPPDWILPGSVSDKALFRFLSIPGRIVFIDEAGEISPGAVQTIKRAMSHFQGWEAHNTLDKDHKPISLEIAPRQLFLFTAVDDFGDEQLADRFLVISLKKNPENDQDYLKFTIDQALKGGEDYPITDKVMICRAMINLIKNQLFRVVLPGVDKITITRPGRRRDIRLYLDLVKAMAVLRFMQRKRYRTEGDPPNIVTLEADPRDYRDALEVFTSMGPRIQDMKLSKDELAIWDFIAVNMAGEASFPELVEQYGETYSKVRRLIEGRPDRDGGTGGLQGKIPGLSITHEDRRVTNDKTRKVKVVRCPVRRPGLDDYIPLVILPPELLEPYQNGAGKDQGTNDGEEIPLPNPAPKNGQEPKASISKNKVVKERERERDLSPAPYTDIERSQCESESVSVSLHFGNGAREEITTKETHSEPETEKEATGTLQNFGTREPSLPQNYGKIAQKYELMDVVKAAEYDPSKVPDLEGLRQAWQAVRKGEQP